MYCKCTKTRKCRTCNGLDKIYNKDINLNNKGGEYVK